MTDFNEVQDRIYEKLKARAALAKFDIHEVAVPTGYRMKQQNGDIWPYVIVAFGGKSNVRNDYQGIGNSADDLDWTSVAVECVAASPSIARRVANIIRKELEGYEPDPDWGMLSEVLAGDYAVRKPDADIDPIRFANSLVFSGMTGAYSVTY